MSKFPTLDLWRVFAKLPKAKKSFILMALLCSFLIALDYSIIRPVSNSFFIASHGSARLPYAWLLAIPFNFLLVTLYNFLLPKMGSFRLLCITLGAILATNTLAALSLKAFPQASFFFYIWKEVYILLMFQQLWSEIHSVIESSLAKLLYGIMYGMGALGAVCGSFFPGFFAKEIGSHNLLFATFPIYSVLGFVFYKLLSCKSELGTQLPEHSHKIEKAHPLEGLRLIVRSKPLLAILSVVVLMQVASTLMDFQFNTLLAGLFPDTDLRTSVYARNVSWIQVFTLFIQFFGAYYVIERFGVRNGHIAIPLVLLFCSITFTVVPSFMLASIGYITIKTLDFSLFSVLKEMLYVPLKLDEKYRAKSFIDIFAYRGSKSIASLFILVIQFLGVQDILKVVSYGSIVIFTLWIGITFFLLRPDAEKLEV